MRIIAAMIALFGMAPLEGSASPLERHAARDMQSMHFSRAAHSSTTLNDGSVLVVGGFMGEEHQVAGVEVFDPKQQRFNTIDDALTPRQSHTATLLPDGRVLIAGGYANGECLKSAELFDPATQRFSSAGRMKTARADHTAVLLSDGRVALIGGTGAAWATLGSIEVFDSRTGEFSEAGHMTVPRTGHVSALLRDGRIFIAGGRIGRRDTVKIYDTSELFDPRTGRSMSSAAMRTPRHKHDAALLADGRVLITGGSDARDGRGMYDSAEIYDPSRDVFTGTATMNKARYKHRGSSLLLPTGELLITGGAAQPELYDASSDRFTLVDIESGLHGSFSAVAMLKDRRVLITGGYFRPDAPSRRAWLYQF